MSDSGGNFISDKFKILPEPECRASSIIIIPSPGQLTETCIKLIKCTIKKWIGSKSDTHIALLQIRSTLLGPELSSPAMLLFGHLIEALCQ